MSARKVLVAYATRCGSTEGVARAITEELVSAGFDADVASVQDVTDLSPYSAAVVGSPIHAGRWLGEARRFLSDNQAILSSMPVACFALAMSTVGRTGEARKPPMAWFDQPKALVEPVEGIVFDGACDRSLLSPFWRLLLWLIRTPEGDFRDWDAIREWARSLPAKLALVEETA